MGAFDPSGRARALRRGAGAVLLQPPPGHLSTAGWHLIDCAEDGVKLLQWRPGVYRWLDKDGVTSTPAERAGARDWVYLGYHGPSLGDH